MTCAGVDDKHASGGRSETYDRFSGAEKEREGERERGEGEKGEILCKKYSSYRLNLTLSS